MRIFRLFASVLLFSVSAWAGFNSTDLSQWMPELPPASRAPEKNRARHLDYWLQHVRPGMSVTQVLVMLGHPDWGITSRGKIRWVANPRDGVLQYSASGRSGLKDGGRVIRIHFDEQARVKRIVDNGVIIAKGRRVLLPDPLPRGVWWRR